MIRRKSIGGGLYEVRREIVVGIHIRVERLGKVKKLGRKFYAIITGKRPQLRDTFPDAAADLEAIHQPKQVR